MRFSERKEFLYDPELGEKKDGRIALRLFDEYCQKFSARPPPRFFEVNRDPAGIDPIWHENENVRHQFLRTLDIYGINQFQKPSLTELLKTAITYQRKDTFWLSNLALKAFDYWPLRGDYVYWNGYRYMVLHVGLPPECHWGQTGLWTGLTVDCIVPAGGDALPSFPGETAPAETEGNKLSSDAS